MCLYVDFDKTIDDAKTYTFYKVYMKVNKTKKAPLGLESPYQGSKIKSWDLVARYSNGIPLPENGQEAYDKVAGEYWTISNSGQPNADITEGLHAYVNKERALEGRRYFLRKNEQVIVAVEVKGEHIIAFGNCDDVAFTRGKIVREVK